ncbi:MAG: hypothetical protein AAGI68_14760, partial [Planctomycetota bacterium]
IGNNSGKSQGVFTAMLTDFVAEENFFYRNGWHPDVAEAVRNKFNHNLYMAENNDPAIVRGNVMVSPGSHSAQMRGGGRFEDNLVVDSPLGAFVRTNPSAMRRNTVLFSPETPDRGAADGIGLQAFNLSDVDMSDNVIAFLANGGDGRGLEARDRVGDGTVRGNVVFQWPGEIRTSGSVNVTGNLFNPDASRLIDPTRNVARYQEHLGGRRSQSDFFNWHHNRPMGAWDDDRTGTAASRWIRAGFQPAPFD